MRLWLKADAGIVADAEGRMEQWQDQSGNANHAAQPGANNRPEVRAAGLNEFPVVGFDATQSQYLQLPNVMSGATEGEVFILVRSAEASGQRRGLWQFNTYGSMHPYEDGRIFESFGVRNSNYYYDTGTPPDITQWRLYNVSAKNDEWVSRFNGRMHFRTANGTITWTASPVLGSGYSGAKFNGEMAEVIIYDHVLSAGERQAVERYLAGKYKLGGTEVPDAPTELKVRAIGSTQAGLTWQSNGNEWVRFEVERKAEAGAWALVATVSGRSWMDEGLVPGASYTYRVTAVNPKGKSESSDEVDVAMSITGASMPTEGMRLWLRPDGLSEGPLGSWTDYSGLGNSANAPSASNSPEVASGEAGLNGWPVIKFDAAKSQYFNLPNLMNGASEGEVFILVRSAEASGQRRGLWQFNTYGSMHPYEDGRILESFGARNSNYYYDTGTPPDITQWRLYNVSAKNDEWVSRFDGRVHFRTANGTITWTASPVLGSGYSGAKFNGEMAEVIIYDHVLSAGERQAVERYLAGKYELGGTEVPDAPTELKARPIGSTQAGLTWQSDGSEWVWFEVERKTGDGEWATVATVAGRSWMDEGLVPGMSYTYRVTAINPNGKSEPSDEVDVAMSTTGASMPMEGMRLWLRPDGLVDGPLGSWTDNSGAGNSANAPAASNSPEVVSGAAGLNGWPVVKFDAAKSQYLNLPNLMNGASAGEVFILVRSAEASGQRRGLWQFNTYGSMHPYEDGRIFESFGVRNSNYYYDTGTPPDITQWRLYNVSAKNDEWVSRFDGRMHFRTANGTITWTASPVLGSGYSGAKFNGEMAEVIIYDHVLSAGERQAVERYLAGKYELGGTEVPDAPAELKARSIGSTQAGLTWQSDGDEWTWFEVDRKTGDGEWATVATVAGHSWMDEGLTAGASYSYRVVAVNPNGKGESSNEASITMPDISASMPTVGMRLWLRPDGLADGPLGSWTDYSGLGNTANAPSANNSPEVVSGEVGLNGWPVVKFDAAKSQYLNLPNLMNGATEGEVFILVRSAEASGQRRSLWTFGTNASLYPYSDGSVHEGFGVPSSNLNNTGMPPDITQWRLYNVSAKNGEWISRFDGSVHFRVTGKTVGWNSGPVLGGGYNYSYGNLYFNGEMAEIIIYDHVLSAGERQAVERYLADKYELGGTEVPDAPTELKARSIGSTQAGLTWQSDGGEWVWFEVERKTTGGDWAVVTTVSGRSWMDEGLTAGASYSYRVVAVNPNGKSEPGDEADVVMPTDGSSMPTVGIRLWLRPDGLADGPLGSWTDYSGLGNSANAPSANNSPEVVSGEAGLNGWPVVKFDATKNQYLNLPNLMNGAAEGEVFILVRSAEASGQRRSLWTLGSYASMYPYSDGSVHESFGIPNYSLNNMGVPPDITQWRLYNVSAKNGEWISRFDGSVHFRVTDKTVGWSSSPVLGGGYNYSYGNLYFNGEMAEVIIYDHVLSAGERQAVERYLAGKYELGGTGMPDAPTELKARSIGSTQAGLTWQSDGGEWVWFEVERKTAGGDWAVVTTVAGRSWMDEGLTPGASYRYRVVAVNPNGKSEPSHEADVAMPTDGSSMPTVGMRLWLRPDGLSEGPLGSWTDYSGLGNSANAPSANNSPEVVSGEAGLNGWPVVKFDATKSQYLNLPNLMNGTAEGEVFILVRSAEASGQRRSLWTLGSYASMYPYSDGSVHESFGIPNYSLNNMGVPPDIRQWRLYNVSAKNGEWISRFDGSVHFRVTDKTVGWSSSPILGGGYNYSYGNLYFSGEMAEVIIYDHVLSAEERQAVERYLVNKYNHLTPDVPPVPVNLQAAALSSTQASVSWDSATETRIGEYYVLERKTGAEDYVHLADIFRGRVWLDTGLVSGETYTYRIKTANASGESDWSDEASVTMPDGGATMPVSGLRLWLRADRGIGNDPLSVSRWRDQSGRGNDAEVLSGAAPRQVADGAGERLALQFTSTTSAMGIPSKFMKDAGTGALYVVLNPDPQTTRRKVLQIEANGGLYYPSDATQGITDDFGRSGQPVSVSIPSNWTMSNTWRAYRVESSGNGWAAWLDGMKLGEASGEANFEGSTSIGGNSWTGRIAEILVYDRVLSEEENAALDARLRERYWAESENAPTGLTAQALGERLVRLAWSTVPGDANVYEIERRLSPSGGWIKIAEATRASVWLDGTAGPATAYDYRVRLRQPAISSWSGEASVTTPAPVDVSGVATEGLKLWLRADAGVEGQPAIQRWIDQSGNGYHLSQPNPAQQPGLAQGDQGELAVLFAGAGQQMPSTHRPLSSSSPSGDLFVVVRSPSATRARAWSVTQSAGTYYPNHADAGSILDSFGRSGAEYAVPVPEGQPLADTWRLYETSAGADDWAVRLDGGLLVRIPNGKTYFYNGYVEIGQGQWKGEIAEVLLYDRVLPSGERHALELYLSGKYQLQPAGAPPDPGGLRGQSVDAAKIMLAWDAPEEWRPGIEYVIERQSPASPDEWQIIGAIENATSFLDSGLEPGIAYSYRLSARNFAGISDPCAPVSVTTVSPSETAFPTENILWWLRADAGIPGATSVGIWHDQGSRAWHADQATLASRPLVATASLNGRPTVLFDAPNHAVTPFTQWKTDTTRGEIFTLARIESPALGELSGRWTRIHILPVNDAWSIRAAGREIARLPDWRAFFGNGSTLAYSSGLRELAEFIIFDRALSDGERMTVDAYLENKYAWDGASVRFTPAPGLHAAPLSVSLGASSANPGVIIRYTLDGAEPQPASPVYTAPIAITQSTRIRARAWVDGVAGDEADGLFSIGLPEPAIRDGSGLWAEYCALPDFLENSNYARIDARLDFKGGSSLYMSPLPWNQPLTVRWSGVLMPRFTEPHTLHLDVQNGVKVWLGGDLVIDEPGETGRRDLAIPFQGAAGQPVPVVIEYSKPANTPHYLSLSWSGLSFARNIIPAAFLHSGRDFNTTLATPTATPLSGQLLYGGTVRINPPSGSQVRYTLDGSIPGPLSPLYLEPVTLQQAAAIKARAYRDGYNPGGMMVERYAMDNTGPVLAALQFDQVPVPAVIASRSGVFSIDAQDTAGVARVEFFLDGQLMQTATKPLSGNRYGWTADFSHVPDGGHTLRIIAHDKLGLAGAPFEQAFTLAYPAPAAPVITKPLTGTLVGNPRVEVRGTAEPNATVHVFLQPQGQSASEAVSVKAAGDGAFISYVTLVEGLQTLTARATNRTGTPGPFSTPVSVTVDLTRPGQPLALDARSQPDGRIALVWRAPAEGRPLGYHIYRIDGDVYPAGGSVASATRITSARVSSNNSSYSDRPPADGTYSYAITSVAKIGADEVEGEPSAWAHALSDRIKPSVTQLVWRSVDTPSLDGTFGAGRMGVEFTVSEDLATAPEFSLQTTGGKPQPVSLRETAPRAYAGEITWLPSEVNGPILPSFRGIDPSGNAGTVIENAASAWLDTTAPAVVGLTRIQRTGEGEAIEETEDTPAIRNLPAPVTIGWLAELNEAAQGTPNFYALLTGGSQARQPLLAEVSAADASGRLWQIWHALPGDAGAEQAELLKLQCQTVDELGNEGGEFLVPAEYQIYTSQLPPLATPAHVTARARPAGRVELEWETVPGAIGYSIQTAFAATPDTTPGDAAFADLARVEGATAYAHTPANDGLWFYRVASIRRVADDEGLSAWSEPVMARSDRVPPPSPVNLQSASASNGVSVSWSAPAGGLEDVAHYALYRGTVSTASLSSLQPVATSVARTSTWTVDVNPDGGHPWYHLVSVDAAGNVSAPAVVFWEAGVMPVRRLTLTHETGGSPVLVWEPVPASVYDGFRVAVDGGEPAPGLLPATAATWTDTGYADGARLYTVQTVGAEFTQSRSIELPALGISIPQSASLRRGLVNRIPVELRNHSGGAIKGVSLSLEIDGRVFAAEGAHEIPAGEAMQIPVIAGGGWQAATVLPARIRVSVIPQANVETKLVRDGSLAVHPGTLTTSLEVTNLVRGGQGKVVVTIGNPGDEPVDIEIGRNYGRAVSGEARIRLVDDEGREWGVIPLHTGGTLEETALPGGIVVVRIAPGHSWTSSAYTLPVPLDTPAFLTARLEIDAAYYAREDAARSIKLPGFGAAVRQSTRESDLVAEITGIAPRLSHGDVPVRIDGLATWRANGAPAAATTLILFMERGGYRYREKIVTGLDGAFTHTLPADPLNRGGRYAVWAQAEGIEGRPAVTEEFVIRRVAASPSAFNVRVPRHYTQTSTWQVASGFDNPVANVRLEPVDPVPAGIGLTLPAPVSLASTQTKNLAVTLRGTDTAPDSGVIRLRVVSDDPEGGAAPVEWTQVELRYEWIASSGVLNAAPGSVQLGVIPGGFDSALVTFSNTGYGKLSNLTLDLVPLVEGGAVPAWLRLQGGDAWASLDIGEKREVSLSARAPDTPVAADEVHWVKIRAQSPGLGYAVEVPVEVVLSPEGKGRASIHVVDPWYQLPPEPGQSNPSYDGLPGASVQLQKENSTGQYVLDTLTLATNGLGEVYFDDLPAGRYRLRVSAPKHTTHTGMVVIKPGINHQEQVALDYEPVSITWNVKEVTIQDEYDIEIMAEFETHVPVPVVVVNPTQIRIPSTLRPGQEFLSEVRISNHGLIAADALTLTVPADPYFEIEYEPLPSSRLEAGQEIRLGVRVRVIDTPWKLKDEAAAPQAAPMALAAGAAAASAGGSDCGSWVGPSVIGYTYQCINGILYRRAIYSYLTSSWGPCPPGDGGGGGPVVIFPPGGGAPRGDDDGWGNGFGAGSTVDQSSGGGGGNGNNNPGDPRPPNPPPPDVDCPPPPPPPPPPKCPDPENPECDEECTEPNPEDCDKECDKPNPEDCDKDPPCKEESGNTNPSASRREPAGSWVDLASRQYLDAATDLRIPIPGGDFMVRRDYAGLRWRLHVAEGLQFAEDTLAGRYVIVAGEAYFKATVTAPGTPNPRTGDDSITPLPVPAETVTAGVYVSSGNRSRRIVKNADGTWQWLSGTGGERHYDAAGRFIRAIRRGRLWTTCEYEDGEPRIARLKDATGRVFLTMTGTPGRGVVTLRDHADREIAYTWTESGRLVSYVNVMGRETTYAYGRYGEMLSKTRPGGITTTVTYTDVGEKIQPGAAEIPVPGVPNPMYAPVYVEAVTDAEGRAMRFHYSYDQASRTYYARVVTRAGLMSEKWFDAAGTLMQWKKNGELMFTYAQKDDVATHTYKGRAVRDQLDARGNVIRSTPLAGDATPEIFEYDPVLNKRTRRVGPDGVETRWSYDANGNLLRMEEASGTPLARVTAHTYHPGTNLRASTTDALGRVTTFAYNALGLLVRETAPDGAVTLRDYDTLGRETLLTDALGGQIRYEYDASGHVIRETDALGVQTRRVYDEAGRLVEVREGLSPDAPDGTTAGRVTRHRYDLLGNRVETSRVSLDSDGVTEVAEVVERIAYDADDRVVSRWTHTAGLEEYAYDGQGRLIRARRPTPAGGTVDELSAYDAAGNRIARTWHIETSDAAEIAGTVLPPAEKWDYDGEGRVLTHTVGKGTAHEIVTHYAYDAAGRQTEALVLAQSQSGSGVPPFPESATTAYKYDLLGRMIETSGDRQPRVVTTYDALDRVLTETDALGDVTAYVYDDASHQVIQKRNGRVVATTTYDLLGRVVAEADALGHTQRTRYDALGRATHVSVTAASHPANWWEIPAQLLELRAYEWHGGLASVARPSAGGDAVESYDYDVFGRQTAVTLPTGATIATAYGAGDQPVQITHPGVGGLPSSSETRTYSAVLPSLLVASADRAGVQTLYTHDGLGRVLTATQADMETRMVYDAPGRVVEETIVDSSGVAHTRALRDYDAWGQLVKVTRDDPRDSSVPARVTTYVYDHAGRMVSQQGADTYPITYAHDALGRMILMRDGRDSETRWAYDDLGQLATKTYADGSQWSYTYDAAGRLATRTDALGRATAYTHTPAGQLAGVVYENDAPVSFTYDQQGRQLTMTDATGVTTWTHNLLGQPLTEQVGRLGRTLTSAYDALGRRTAVSVDAANPADTWTLNHAYDTAGRLMQITANTGATFRYTYEPGTGRLVSVLSPVHTVTNTYDPVLGYLKQKENKRTSGNAVLSRHVYTVDAFGQRTAVSLEGPYNSGYTYAYNTAGEIVSAAHKNTASRNRAYRFDAIGNREWATEGGTINPGIPEDPAANATAVTHYTANNLNQYTHVGASLATPVSPAHDANGNMTSDGMGRAFAYDEENRLVSVETETTRVAYAYDGLSRRVRRTEFTRANPLATWTQTADRHYLYDGWNVIAEYEGSGGAGDSPVILARTHIWGIDLSNTEQGAGGVGGLLATRENSQMRYYTYDGNGNVSEVLDANGTAQAHYEYDPFGNTTVSTGTWASSNVWRFSTKPFDAASGLYYYGYRFYDPVLGRWINRDPIEEEGGENLYASVANNTINAVDAIGLSAASWLNSQIENVINNIRHQGMYREENNQSVKIGPFAFRLKYGIIGSVSTNKNGDNCVSVSAYARVFGEYKHKWRLPIPVIGPIIGEFVKTVVEPTVGVSGRITCCECSVGGNGEYMVGGSYCRGDVNINLGVKLGLLRIGTDLLYIEGGGYLGAAYSFRRKTWRGTAYAYAMGVLNYDIPGIKYKRRFEYRYGTSVDI
ncbi:hypothetical protein AW736_01935 [Termitidicoccus mucosus]|uniref:Uncharacterized protein n=1 Tax=Termitidicoccus mucosus TaxID=1184151 RepID=A0A178IPB5_9BACT|nr:hypothetical protein AW736_01935 [Opitutaceae bacterium TSB47]